MDNENTSLFSIEELSEKQAKDILNEVYNSLEERGYNATNQIVGYLISGDPGYISSYQDARNKIMEYDRTEIAAMILEHYLEEE